MPVAYDGGMIRLTTGVVAGLMLGLVLAGCAVPRMGDGRGGVGAAHELPPGAVIHYVRIRSGLSDEEAMAVLRERAEAFRELPGLVQKIYGRDAETGEICGVYLFESQAALDAFRMSELAGATREAYQVQSGRVERYDVLFTLHPGVRAD